MVIKITGRVDYIHMMIYFLIEIININLRLSLRMIMVEDIGFMV